jgi:hypothetical protein
MSIVVQSFNLKGTAVMGFQSGKEGIHALSLKQEKSRLSIREERILLKTEIGLFQVMVGN